MNKYYGFDDLDKITPTHLGSFIAYLHNSKSLGTIKNYLSGIGFYYNLYNKSDVTKTFSVYKALTGIQKLSSEKPCRLPITRVVMHKIIDNLNAYSSSKYEINLFKSLFLLAYYGCLRAGELVTSRNNKHTLRYNNVKVPADNSFCSITLTSYKFSKSSSSLVINRSTDQFYCPVLATSQYLELRGNSEGCFFINNRKRPINIVTFRKVLKFCLKQAGLDENKYNTHSFRIGRATDLAAEGATDITIKTVGRWSSAAYKKYIRPEYINLPR